MQYVSIPLVLGETSHPINLVMYSDIKVEVDVVLQHTDRDDRPQISRIHVKPGVDVVFARAKQLTMIQNLRPKGGMCNLIYNESFPVNIFVLVMSCASVDCNAMI